jgi:paraquat-inducible protein A
MRSVGSFRFLRQPNMNARELRSMTEGPRRMTHRACHLCGTIHRLPPTSTNHWLCTKCGSSIELPLQREEVAARTMAAAVGALALYFPAIMLPILTIEQFGQRHQTSLLSGSLELVQHGHFVVGVIVLVFSIVFPLIKILGLLELCWFGLLQRRHQALMFRVMEAMSKWSMLDVMLLALLVMTVKLSGLVEFHLGPAVFAFVGCVAMNLMASTRFDPHAIWE